MGRINCGFLPALTFMLVLLSLEGNWYLSMARRWVFIVGPLLFHLKKKSETLIETGLTSEIVVLLINSYLVCPKGRRCWLSRYSPVKVYGQGPSRYSCHSRSSDTSSVCTRRLALFEIRIHRLVTFTCSVLSNRLQSVRKILFKCRLQIFLLSPPQSMPRAFNNQF